MPQGDRMFIANWPKGQLKPNPSTEPLLIDVVQEAMGLIVSTLKEIDKKTGSLEEETNKTFETLEHEIRSTSNLQHLQNQCTDTQQRVQQQSVETQQCIQKPVNARSDPQELKESMGKTGGVEALKQWTGKARATVVFDSTVDEFTHGGLFDKVQGKPNVAVVGFTTDGDVFGGFYSVAVTEQVKRFYDRDMFIFSFESHGRCKTPQRFVVRERLKEKACVYFYNKSDGFVEFWVVGYGWFYLGNERSNSYCYNMSDAFEGIENTTLTGKNDSYHHCTRLVAIQLE